MKRLLNTQNFYAKYYTGQSQYLKVIREEWQHHDGQNRIVWFNQVGNFANEITVKKQIETLNKNFTELKKNNNINSK